MGRVLLVARKPNLHKVGSIQLMAPIIATILQHIFSQDWGKGMLIAPAGFLAKTGGDTLGLPA